MAVLSIDGVEYEVLSTGASEDEPEMVGEESRAFDGTYRNTLQAEKRSYRFAIFGTVAAPGPMSQADLETLRTAIALGAVVSVDGDFIEDGPLNCFIKMSSSYLKISGTAFARQPILVIKEA